MSRPILLTVMEGLVDAGFIIRATRGVFTWASGFTYVTILFCFFDIPLEWCFVTNLLILILFIEYVYILISFG